MSARGGTRSTPPRNEQRRRNRRKRKRQDDLGEDLELGATVQQGGFFQLPWDGVKETLEHPNAQRKGRHTIGQNEAEMGVQQSERFHDEEVRNEDDDAGEHLNQQEGKHRDVSSGELVSAEGISRRDGHGQTHQGGTDADDEGIAHPGPKGVASEHVGEVLSGVRPAKGAAQSVARRERNIKNPNKGQQGQDDEVQENKMGSNGAKPGLVALISRKTVLNGFKRHSSGGPRRDGTT